MHPTECSGWQCFEDVVTTVSLSSSSSSSSSPSPPSLLLLFFLPSSPPPPIIHQVPWGELGGRDKTTCTRRYGVCSIPRHPLCQRQNHSTTWQKEGRGVCVCVCACVRVYDHTPLPLYPREEHDMKIVRLESQILPVRIQPRPRPLLREKQMMS